MTTETTTGKPLKCRVDYAYTLRQSDRSNGADHFVVLEELHAGRLHRQAGDALCRPRHKFWGLEPTKRTEADCKRCLEIARRLDLPAIDRGPTHPFILDESRFVHLPDGRDVRLGLCGHEADDPAHVVADVEETNLGEMK